MRMPIRVCSVEGLVTMLTAIYSPLSEAGIVLPVDWSSINIPDKSPEEWEEIRKLLAQPTREAFYNVRVAISIDIRNSLSLEIFKSKLKTFLFRRAYAS